MIATLTIYSGTHNMGMLHEKIYVPQMVANCPFSTHHTWPAVWRNTPLALSTTKATQPKLAQYKLNCGHKQK